MAAHAVMAEAVLAYGDRLMLVRSLEGVEPARRMFAPERSGSCDRLVGALVRDSLALMERAGFRQFYDPRAIAGLGSTDFSWSGALVLEIMDNV